MSKVANWTAAIVVLSVFNLGFYGYGYSKGRNSLMTIDQAITIAKAQFTCKMEKK